ncbi:endonuclease [Acholeplasma vituli]|uniref:Endonuclease n=1 Tax=Paracholeplasma vituli TaxID=69473 RepID=A0ABT2Q143_9MOLU|nr:endonuclease [Paracholeplasma vituli]MCU0105638.1 endonuclease [Paracholeplasma vituli]
MATKNQTVTITSSGGGGTPDPGIPAGYYDSITVGLTGSALRQALTTRVSNHTIISYSNAQYTLDEADADPNAAGKILTIYDRKSVSSTWDSGSTWNKEHVWPQSSYDEASPMVSDLHHLRAAVPTTNSTRGNNYFNIISGHTLGTWKYFDSRFFPGDVDKGDVARMLLYMAVRYYNDNLRLVKSDFGTTARNARTLGDIDILLTWHQEDPVDAFEVNRNNVIYGVQNNRNPFIDRPDLFEPVWTYLVSVAQTLQASIQLYEKAIEDYATLMVTYTPTSTSTKGILI